MKKKNRLSFSSISIESDQANTGKTSHAGSHTTDRHKTSRSSTHTSPRKRTSKSSTFQYTQKGFGGKRGSFGNKGGTKLREESKIPPVEPGTIRVIPLGGVEEVGRNMLLVESEHDIVVLDVGFHFIEEDETMGVDFTLPNFKYLEERKEKIRAVAITHGHLDHIGGIPFIMDRIGNPPIYAQYLTTLMIKKRQDEFPANAPLNINVVDPDSVIRFNELALGFFPVVHSIPDSMGVKIITPLGNILVSGDMKLEHEGAHASAREEKKWTALGKEKPLLMIADSTSSEIPGFSIAEKEVQKNLENIIRTTEGRLIIGTFASQFDRMIRIVQICEQFNKKIVPEGRSIKNNLEIAKLAGLLNAKEETFIEAQDVENYPPNKIVIIATGAQGEEFAALMRMATNKHKYLRLHPTDTVVLSSSAIPGNELNIQKLKDHLYRHDLKLIHYGTAEVHSGGHARQEDLVLINKMVNPKFFMPGYGNHFMLRIHAQLIQTRNNFPRENIVVPDNGMIVEFSDNGNKMTVRKERAPSSLMVVDGLKIGDVQDVVVRDRVLLAQDGMFVIVALIDQKTGKLKKSPDLISRGFVYLKENQELLHQVRLIIKKSVEEAPVKRGGALNTNDFDQIKASLGENVSKFLFQKTAKRPLVIPVILSV